MGSSISTLLDHIQESDCASDLLGFGSDAVAPLAYLAISDGSCQRRSAAARILGRIGDQRAVEALLGALQDRESLVRETAAEALGAIGDGRAARPLVHALGDATSLVRRCAAVSLGQIGEPAVEPLIQELWDPGIGPREALLDAICAVGPLAVEALTVTLERGGWTARRDALAALNRMGGRRYLAARVVADGRLTAAKRLRALRRLLPLYRLSGVRQFCSGLKASESAAVRQGALEILMELDRGSLVRPLAGVAEELLLRPAPDARRGSAANLVRPAEFADSSMVP